MTRTIIRLLIVFSLSLSCTTWLLAQSLSAYRFLDGVSAHPVGDQVEMKQSAEIYQALIIAPPADVKRVLSAVLRYTRPGNQVNVGAYALRFLLGITARPDGADLLSSKSEEISSLIADVNPGFQAGIASIAEILMMQPATNTKPYVAALTAAVQNQKTRRT